MITQPGKCESNGTEVTEIKTITALFYLCHDSSDLPAKSHILRTAKCMFEERVGRALLPRSIRPLPNTFRSRMEWNLAPVVLIEWQKAVRTVIKHLRSKRVPIKVLPTNWFGGLRFLFQTLFECSKIRWMVQKHKIFETEMFFFLKL